MQTGKYKGFPKLGNPIAPEQRNKTPKRVEFQGFALFRMHFAFALPA